jgi:adenylate kinase family enzyme
VSDTSARRVHVLGGSGSGTTTLARALAAELRSACFDTDDFYWLPSDPPFQHKREIPARITLLDDALFRHDNWVLSGSFGGWGDVFIPYLTDVIFLTLAPSVRMARLRAREVTRYGHVRIAPGGDLHHAHEAFMEWAALYDVSGHSQRSLDQHERWIAQLPSHVSVHRFTSDQSLTMLLRSTRDTLSATNS